MASVTVPMTGYSAGSGLARWSDDVLLGATFDLGGQPQTFSQLSLGYQGAFVGRISLVLLGIDDRFTAAFVASGRIIIEASDGELLEVMIADADMSEPYTWIPANSGDVTAFANHVQGLTDHNATLTLTDDPAITTIPLWVGDASSYVQAEELHVGDGGEWKQAEALWVGDGGAWKSVF